MSARQAGNRRCLAVLACCLFLNGAGERGALAGSPGEILVKMAPGVSDREIEEVSARRSWRATTTYPRLGVRRVQLPPGRSADEEIAALNRDPRVEYAEADAVIWENVRSNDPGLGAQWGLHQTGEEGGTPDADIDAPEAWDVQAGDRSVVIAVIDSGIDLDHPDLRDNLFENHRERPNGVDDDGNGYVDDLDGWDFLNDDPDPSDGRGHGTHVSGIAAAAGDNGIGVSGVAWTARVLPLKVLSDCCGSGQVSDAVEAILYAIDMRADVINASWSTEEPSRALRDAIDLAGRAGIVVVAAAGNRASDNDASPRYPASFDLSNVIAVSATDRNDRPAFFSNFGRRSVDVGAPGLDIVSTKPDGPVTFPFGPPRPPLSPERYGTMSGTSAAAPFVTGLVALVKSEFHHAGVREIRSRVLGGVDRLPALRTLTAAGGRINAARSLTMALGKISGRVSDAEGQPVPAAWVVLRNVRTFERMRTVTNHGGVYSFRDLAPGRYRVAAGMRASAGNRAVVNLSEGGEDRINFTIDYDARE